MTRLKKGAETMAMRNLYHASHGTDKKVLLSHYQVEVEVEGEQEGIVGRNIMHNSVKFKSHNPKPVERCKANVFPLTVFKMNDPGAKTIAKQPSHPKADT